MTKAYFRRADGVMLLYDVTNEKSFLNVRQWIQGIEEVTERAVPITLCGNKLDLRNESRAQGISCVDTSQGRKLAEENKAIFMETSSKTGDNILEAVLALSYEMLMQEDSEVKTSAMEIKSEPTKTCCASKK
ncbi:GTP-binding protein Rheb homolog [Gryllus bimaculatus]|nr:GTP-binding protein Rheb homolog [Gryllus bimaculatus]